ncbi:MAG TPA: cation-translocating P-type ATPase [Leptolyngbyaceae cyanobacterium M65_K2018_010]|nr:cation-translocating P-type ATPase [Leptolyngbyaceae cyanobacterium M65_K2018_010]
MAWEQLTEPLVVLLIVAAALSALLGDYREAVVILMIVVLNGLLGVSQEYRAEQHIMARPPYAPGENFFSRGLGWSIVWVGILMGGFSLGTGYWAWRQGLPTWQTMLFTVLTLSQMGNALALRSERNSFWQVGPWSNPALLGAVALTLAAQVAVIYTLPLRTLFYTQPLSLGEFLLCLGLSSGVFWCIEAEKWWQRHRLKAKTGSPRS